MAFFHKSDLNFSDYKWKTLPSDDPFINAPPETAVFDRKNGNEVLYMINKYCELYKEKTLECGQEIEYMIRNTLPIKMRNHKEVRLWIYENWHKVTT